MEPLQLRNIEEERGSQLPTQSGQRITRTGTVLGWLSVSFLTELQLCWSSSSLSLPSIKLSLPCRMILPFAVMRSIQPSAESSWPISGSAVLCNFNTAFCRSFYSINSTIALKGFLSTATGNCQLGRKPSRITQQKTSPDICAYPFCRWYDSLATLTQSFNTNRMHQEKRVNCPKVLN